MEKCFKNCTTSLVDFYYHPLSYISDLFSPFSDSKWFLKSQCNQEQVSDVQVYTTTVRNTPFTAYNLPQKQGVYVTNMCFKSSNKMNQSKTTAYGDVKPNTVEQCWENCSSRSKTLAEEIARLKSMIRELSYPFEPANLQEDRTMIKSQMGKDRNKKVQANIHNNQKNKTTETENFRSVDNLTSNNEIGKAPVRSGITGCGRPSKSKFKKTASMQKQPSGRVLFGNDDFEVLVSKGRQEEKSTAFDVSSKSSQDKNNSLIGIFSRPSNAVFPVAANRSSHKSDRKVQESFTKLKPQELKFQRDGAAETIVNARNPCPCPCCSHRGRGLYYHNYITIPGERTNKDDKLLQNLANEVELQKAELQRVKATLNDLMRNKNLGEREVYSYSYQNNPPGIQQRYNDVGVSQRTAELMREDVAGTMTAQK